MISSYSPQVFRIVRLAASIIVETFFLHRKTRAFASFADVQFKVQTYMIDKDFDMFIQNTGYFKC